jgi:hypothetical protein
MRLTTEITDTTMVSATTIVISIKLKPLARRQPRAFISRLLISIGRTRGSPPCRNKVVTNFL